MSPEEVEAHYREMIADAGETVTVRRYYGVAMPRPYFEAADVPAKISGYAPEELAGSVQQGDVRAVILYSDLVERRFPVPLVSGDRLIIGGKELAIVAPDGATRRVNGVIIAYDALARGQSL